MAKIIGMGDDKAPTRPEQPMMPKLSMSDSKPMICQHEEHGEKCGNDVFVPAMKFRKISKLLAGTDQDVLIPLEVYFCTECGNVNQELLPAEVRETEKNDKTKNS